MINLLEHQYTLIRDDNCFNLEEVKDKITDYFEPYDYICGDYAYNKLRLKGFYDKKNASEINSIEEFDNYIHDYCAYGAKIFLLKKEK